MKTYIFQQTVKAVPAWRLTGGDGHEHVVTEKPVLLAGETMEEGYKVFCPGSSEAWFTHREVFEAQYRPGCSMTFGDALEAMKDGKRVAREGWNGEGMYIFLAYEPDFVTDADISAFDGKEVTVGDMIVMKTAQDTFAPGWLASQADMLAEDWFVVE